jgi:hypothetical protein
VVDWASIAPVQYHPGADWAAGRSDADAVQKQPDAVQREQQRIESYYRDQTRLQEERQRREAEEALAARQRSPESSAPRVAGPFGRRDRGGHPRRQRHRLAEKGRPSEGRATVTTGHQFMRAVIAGCGF